MNCKNCDSSNVDLILVEYTNDTGHGFFECEECQDCLARQNFGDNLRNKELTRTIKKYGVKI